jgi:uncharacterized protein (TIGR03435 family)
MRCASCRVVVAVVTMASTVTAFAQQPPAFEVASIKRNTAGRGSPQRVGVNPGDRVTLTNVPLLTLIQVAYAPVTEVVGGPDWIGKQGQPNFDVDRFDVVAKAAAPATRDELTQMLRTLLTERFKLAVHTETRSEPIWAIVLARRDGRLGPNLHPARATCAELRGALAPNPDPCGMQTYSNALVSGYMSVRGRALDLLAILALEVGRRPVVDKTGLAGTFDWELTWLPVRFVQDPSLLARPPSGIDANAPALPTALEQQLGLKFESQRGEGTVLVVDRVEHPSEN